MDYRLPERTPGFGCRPTHGRAVHWPSGRRSFLLKLQSSILILIVGAYNCPRNWSDRYLSAVGGSRAWIAVRRHFASVSQPISTPWNVDWNRSRGTACRHPRNARLYRPRYMCVADVYSSGPSPNTIPRIVQVHQRPEQCDTPGVFVVHGLLIIIIIIIAFISGSMVLNVYVVGAIVPADIALMSTRPYVSQRQGQSKQY